MIKLSKDNAKRQLSIHGWAGLILGFLLYVIIFTGTVVVFIDELNQWSISGNVVEQPLNSSENESIDSVLNSLVTQVPEGYRDNISIRSSYQGYLRVTFSTNEKSSVSEEAVITEYLINPNNLKIIATGDTIDIVANSWVRFIRTFHTDLYIPGILSRYIVGMFGMMLLIATVSGFLIHRHIIKDMFLSPRKSNKTIEQRDGHNLAGTWSLPFAFLLGLTGAVICFDSRISLPAMVVSVFQGDVKKAMSTLIVKQDIDEVYNTPRLSIQDKENNKPTEKSAVDSIIQTSTNLIGVSPTRLTIEGYTQDKSLITTYHPTLNIDNDIFYHSFLFNGQGDFIKELGGIGDIPTVSSRSFQLVSTLHYGDFAGWLSKLVWFVLSGMLCYVIITGFRLWFEKRIKQLKWQRLYPSVPIMVYGVPVSLITAGFGYFISSSGGTAISELDAIWIGFGVGWLLSLLSLFAIKFNPQSLKYESNSIENFTIAMLYIKQYFRFISALMLIAMPFIRFQTSQIGWSSLIDSNNSMVVCIDVFFIIVGLMFYGKFLKQSSAHSE